jgi:hypothetical protein
MTNIERENDYWLYKSQFEEEEEEAPEEGDYIIESRPFGKDVIYKYNDSPPWRHAIQEDDNIYKIISDEMERENSWPNVWTLSDHGNLSLISLESLKEEN